MLQRVKCSRLLSSVSLYLFLPVVPSVSGRSGSPLVASMLMRSLPLPGTCAARRLLGLACHRASPGLLPLRRCQAGQNATRQLLMHGELQTQLVGLGRCRRLRAQECERVWKRIALQCWQLGLRHWRRLVQCASTAMAALTRVGYLKSHSGLLLRAPGAGRLNMQGDAGAGGRQGAGVEGARRELRVHSAHQPPGLQGRRAEGGAAPELWRQV